MENRTTNFRTTADLERAYPSLCAQLRQEAIAAHEHARRTKLAHFAGAEGETTTGEELMKRAVERANAAKNRRNAA